MPPDLDVCHIQTRWPKAKAKGTGEATPGRMATGSSPLLPELSHDSTAVPKKRRNPAAARTEYSRAAAGKAETRYPARLLPRPHVRPLRVWQQPNPEQVPFALEGPGGTGPGTGPAHNIHRGLAAAPRVRVVPRMWTRPRTVAYVTRFCTRF